MGGRVVGPEKFRYWGRGRLPISGQFLLLGFYPEVSSSKSFSNQTKLNSKCISQSC